MSQFDELLKELQTQSDEQATLAKALPAEDGKDDKQIQAAAAEGDTDADNENPEDGHEEPDGDEGEAAEGKEKPMAKCNKPMTKSVTALVDGEEVEAVDATELLKSLETRVGEHDAVLAKALSTTLATVKSQTELIKSLSARLDKLAGQGAGRKTVIAVQEKPATGDLMAKSQQDGFTPASFMAKASAAFAAGKLSGKELTTIDVALRTGQLSVLGDELIAKALS